jgi:hypothetical protein
MQRFERIAFLLPCLAVAAPACKLTVSGDDAGGSSSSRAPSITIAPAPAPVAAAAPAVTKAKYDQLRTGMKYAEAAKILGSPGEEMSSSQLAGIKTAMYRWQNDDFSSLTAMFQNDKLVTKSQFRLR